MAVVTLLDYKRIAGQKKDPLFLGLVTDLLRKSDLMGVVPFKTVDGLEVKGARWNTLPTAAYRKLGEAYGKSKGTTEPINETLVLLGGEIQIDRVLTKVKDTFVDQLAMQMDMLSTVIAWQFNYSFIAGDIALNVDEFEGLKKRVSNFAARYTVWLDSNGVGTGDALKVLADAASEHKFVDAMHKAIKYSNATHLLMNETTYLGMGQVLRRLGLLDTTTDQYGRTFDYFASGSRKIPLIDIGLKSDQSTEVITNTEDPGDGGNDASSVYAVRLSTDDGVHGLQLADTSPEPYDPLNGNEMETAPAFLRRVDWPVGLFAKTKRCICRVAGFKMAAA